MAKIHPAIILAAVLMDEARDKAESDAAKSLALFSYPENQDPEKVAADVVALLRIGARVRIWQQRKAKGQGHRNRIPRPWHNWSWDWGSKDDAKKAEAEASYTAQATDIAARYGASAMVCNGALCLALASRRSNSANGWEI